MSLCLNLCQLSSVFQGTQPDQKRGQQLAGFVMQFARNPAPFLLLRRKLVFQKEPVYRFGLLDFRGLLAFLLAQIGDHHAQGLAVVSTKPVKRQIDRNQSSICATQVEFAFRNRLLSLGKQSFKSVSLCFRNQRLNCNSDNFPWWPANQLCKPAIAVEHSAIPGQSRRAFAHGLDQHAISGFAAFQRNHPLSATTGNHQSIHFAGLYGAQSFLRSFQAREEFFLPIRWRGWRQFAWGTPEAFASSLPRTDFAGQPSWEDSAIGTRSLVRHLLFEPLLQRAG